MKKQLKLFFIVLVTSCRIGYLQQSEKTTVFPNPATNVINILGLKNATKASIIISDSYGNTILDFKWEIKNNALNIPITKLKQGIYFVKIQYEEQLVQKKFYKK